MHSERAASSAPPFDSLASTYDVWYTTPLGHLVELEKDTVLDLVGGSRGVALDLSCGTGNYALALAQRGFHVVGVDISEPMLRAARSKAARAGLEIGLVRADAGALPLREGVFDLVTIILGLEFVADPGKVLAEARRVLRRGGRLIVGILDRRGLWTRWRRLKRVFVASIWRNAVFLDREKLRGLLRDCGFTDVGWRAAVHFLPLVSRRHVAWLAWWESMGARWMPESATFVVVAAGR